MDIVIVGLYGPMGSGKSTVANALVTSNKSAKLMRFADPLYKMAKLTADWRYEDGDRAAFELFDLVTDVLGGKGAASFMDVAKVVFEEIPALAEGNLDDYVASGTKPRVFLQKLGTEVFRSIKQDCWASYLSYSMILDARKKFEAWQYDRDMAERKLGATFELTKKDDIPDALKIPPFKRVYVIDDMRFPNEFAELARIGTKMKGALSDDANIIVRLVKLELSPEAGAERVAARDYVPIDQVKATLGHASEGSLDDHEFDAVVDASQPIEDVVADVWASVTGKTRTVKGSSLIDFTSLRKR